MCTAGAWLVQRAVDDMRGGGRRTEAGQQLSDVGWHVGGGAGVGGMWRARAPHHDWGVQVSVAEVLWNRFGTLATSGCFIELVFQRSLCALEMAGIPLVAIADVQDDGRLGW